MTLAGRVAAFVAIVTLVAGALAEEWTVQTVAVRDLRLARSIADDLRRGGFDAYTEFTMGSDGFQWVRVRAGCYYDRADADAIATLLQSGVTREAVVVERTPGAPTDGCVEREVGFVVPGAWRQRAAGVAAFEVEVAGVTGLVRYQGGRWQVLQAPATEAVGDRSEAGGTFRQVDGAAGPFVRVRTGAGERYLCAGTLLAEASEAAIVELDGVVSACRLTTPGVGDTQ